MRKKIEEVIVVEGKDDVSAVKAAVDAEVIQTNGFAIKKKGNIERLRVAYEKKGLILLTDPDYVGNDLRNYIQKFFPNVKQAFISRKEGTKNSDIGVENASPEAIIKALESAKCSYQTSSDIFTMEDLLENGLIGRDNSKQLREQLGAVLNIGYSNAKQLLSKLNRYGITREEFENAIKKF